MTLPVSPSASAKPPSHDDFFIGWLRMPRSHARRAWTFVGITVTVGAIVAAMIAAFQQHPGRGEWEPSNVVQFDGYLLARPYAMLLVPAAPTGPERTVLLVEEGKFGAAARVATLLKNRPEGLPVRVRGTLIRREDRFMVELLADDLALRALSPAETASLGPIPSPAAPGRDRVTLRGEMVDSKCFLGAMRPGGGKTHKACAALCIAGGIPPMLLTTDSTGKHVYYLLAGPDGGPAPGDVVRFLGDEVTVTGTVETCGDLPIVRVNAADIRRTLPR